MQPLDCLFVSWQDYSAELKGGWMNELFKVTFADGRTLKPLSRRSIIRGFEANRIPTNSKVATTAGAIIDIGEFCAAISSDSAALILVTPTESKIPKRRPKRNYSVNPMVSIALILASVTVGYYLPRVSFQIAGDGRPAGPAIDPIPQGAVGGKPEKEIVLLANDRARFDGVAQLRDVYETAHINEVRDVKFAANGNQLLSAGTDGNVKFWEVHTGKNIATLPGMFPIVLTPDGTTLLRNESFGALNLHTLWDVDSRKLTRKLTTIPKEIQPIAFGPDGKTLACWGRPANRELCITLWDVTTGNRSRVEQDAGSRLAFEAGLDGIAEPLIDGTFLEAARF